MKNIPFLQHFHKLLHKKSAGKGVTKADFVEAWRGFKSIVDEIDSESEDEIREAFAEYDLDGDGYISKHEMFQVRILCFNIWN